MGEDEPAFLAEYRCEGNYLIRPAIAASAPLTASGGAQDTTTEPGAEEACRTTEGVAAEEGS